MQVTLIKANKLDTWNFKCEQNNRFAFANLGKCMFAWYVLKNVDIDIEKPLYDYYPGVIDLFNL